MSPEQQRVAAELFRKSPGAPFLFEPDGFRIGKTITKPFDLAWAGNGCLILVALSETARPREKMARHNFNSLKNGYREWYGGRHLRGRNACGSFDIPFDQYPHRVLLSVVKGADAASEMHPEVRNDLAAGGCPPPTLCATISENVLDYLAAEAGSLIDLLRFLTGLRPGDPLPADASLRGIRRRHNLCFNGLPSGSEFGGSADNPRLYTNEPLYKALLSCGDPRVPESTRDLLIPTLLSDLGWSEVIPIICHARQLERKAALQPPGMFGIRAASTLMDCPPYLFGLIVSRHGELGGFAQSGEPVSLLQQSLLKHEHCRERLGVLFSFHIGEKGQRFVTARVIPASDDAAPPLQSQTAALLDGFLTLH